MNRNNFIKRATLATFGITLFPTIAFSDTSYEGYLRWFKNEFKHFLYDPIHPDTRYHNIRLEDDMIGFRKDAKVIVDFLEKGIKPYDDWLVKHEDNEGIYASYADIILENEKTYLPNHKKILKEWKIITFDEWKNR